MTTNSAIALSGKSSLATSVGAFITGRGGSIGANGGLARREGQSTVGGLGAANSILARSALIQEAVANK